MKLIPLTQGKFTQVDDADFEWLNQWTWCAQRDRNKFYAVRMPSRKLGKRKLIRMHRILLGDGTFPESDHKDGDGLNNQRENLRRSTVSQNQANRPKQKNNTSGVKGVFWNKKARKWIGWIQNTRLGAFDSLTEAKLAYIQAAKKIYGDFAFPNV